MWRRVLPSAGIQRLRSLEALRSPLEGPRQTQNQREPQQKEEEDDARRLRRQIQNGGKGLGNLERRPPRHQVHDADAHDSSLAQLSPERRPLRHDEKMDRRRRVEKRIRLHGRWELRGETESPRNFTSGSAVSLLASAPALLGHQCLEAGMIA